MHLGLTFCQVFLNLPDLLPLSELPLVNNSRLSTRFRFHFFAHNVDLVQVGFAPLLPLHDLGLFALFPPLSCDPLFHPLLYLVGIVDKPRSPRPHPINQPLPQVLVLSPPTVRIRSAAAVGKMAGWVITN